MVLVRLGGDRRVKKIMREQYIVSVIVLESETETKGQECHVVAPIRLLR